MTYLEIAFGSGGAEVDYLGATITGSDFKVFLRREHMLLQWIGCSRGRLCCICAYVYVAHSVVDSPRCFPSSVYDSTIQQPKLCL
jgi:hypothetical protein